MSDTTHIELIQVFEAESERRCYRFCIRDSNQLGENIVDATSIVSFGKSIPAEIILMEIIDEGDLADAVIISVLIPNHVRFFKIVIAGIGSKHISWFAIRKLVKERDAMMVNPGIDSSYEKWIQENEIPENFPSPEQLEQLATKPSFSIIVPLFNTPSDFLQQMISSVIAQTYPQWELILVNASPENESMDAVLESFDDSRIHTITLADNYGISENTNAGIAVAIGDYICFLDHDDLLSPHALAEYAIAISENPNIDLLYCDEDSISADSSQRFTPRFKPGLNIDLLRSHNYVCHFLAIKRSILNQVEPYTREVNGAQDYDLTLKAIDAGARIRHIPKILYHWRKHADSTNGGIVQAKPYIDAASKLVLEQHYERNKLYPTVSSTDISCVFKTKMPQNKKGVLIIRFSESLSGKEYAEKINALTMNTSSELVFIANDRVAVNAALEDSLKAWFCRSDIGIVSPKMYYPDGLTQHAGLCVRENGSIGHLNQGFIGRMGGGYNGTAEAICNFSAVDSDCMMFRVSDLKAVDGFSLQYESRLVTAVDFCFRIRSLGKVILVDPDASCINNTSVFWSKRIPVWENPSNNDLMILWENWETLYRQDLLANKNVNLSNSYFNLNTN